MNEKYTSHEKQNIFMDIKLLNWIFFIGFFKVYFFIIVVYMIKYTSLHKKSACNFGTKRTNRRNLK